MINLAQLYSYCSFMGYDTSYAFPQLRRLVTGLRCVGLSWTKFSSFGICSGGGGTMGQVSVTVIPPMYHIHSFIHPFIHPSNHPPTHQRNMILETTSILSWQLKDTPMPGRQVYFKVPTHSPHLQARKGTQNVPPKCSHPPSRLHGCKPHKTTTWIFTAMKNLTFHTTTNYKKSTYSVAI